MTSRTATARAIWRARRPGRTGGDRAFALYLAVMLALVAALPVGRALWLGVTDPAVVAALSAPIATDVTAIVVAVLWAAALLVGRQRGPVMAAPFLVRALAASDLPRPAVFGGTLMRSAALVTAVTTLTAGLVAAALSAAGLAGPLGAAGFIAVGALVGVIATVAWLAGQAMPRLAGSIAVIVLIAAGIAATTGGAATALLPWGWVARSLPPSAGAGDILALTALAAALLAAVPSLLHRLDVEALTAQALRWDAATLTATMLDLGGAAAVYRGRPRSGRRHHAVEPRRGLPWRFFVRDMVGAARTPARLVVAAGALAGVGVLLMAAFAVPSAGWLVGGAAGVLAFAALGPLTDGVRHAASVAGDLPLYGVGDEALLAVHTLFPLAALVIVLALTVVGGVFVAGVPLAPALAASLTVGVLALLARVSDALKGPLPPTMLISMPTPMGDPMPVVRLAWALDAVLFSAAAGAAVVAASTSPVFLVAVAASLAAVGVYRWRGRR